MAESSWMVEDEAITGEDDFRGARGGGTGAAVAARPECLARFRADVGQLDVVAHLCSLAFLGTNMLTGVARGETVGGEDGDRAAGGGEAGPEPMWHRQVWPRQM